jgi:hypothetical protein
MTIGESVTERLLWFRTQVIFFQRNTKGYVPLYTYSSRRHAHLFLEIAWLTLDGIRHQNFIQPVIRILYNFLSELDRIFSFVLGARIGVHLLVVM